MPDESCDVPLVKHTFILTASTTTFLKRSLGTMSNRIYSFLFETHWHKKPAFILRQPLFLIKLWCPLFRKLWYQLFKIEECLVTWTEFDDRAEAVGGDRELILEHVLREVREGKRGREREREKERERESDLGGTWPGGSGAWRGAWGVAKLWALAVCHGCLTLALWLVWKINIEKFGFFFFQAQKSKKYFDYT